MWTVLVRSGSIFKGFERLRQLLPVDPVGNWWKPIWAWWKIFNGFPEKSIFHIKIWSPTSVLVQYEQDLGGCFSGICTFLHTLFRAKTAFFGPWGPKFGQKYQKHNVTKWAKIGPMWKRTILGSPDPPKPPQGPPGHPRHPRSLKMAQIINNQSSGDYRSQKSNFWGGSIFFSFFTRNDPADPFTCTVYHELKVDDEDGAFGAGVENST